MQTADLVYRDITPGAMDAAIQASYAPGTQVRPGWMGDPHRAALRNNGVLVGFASQCFACEEWVNDFHDDAKGALNCEAGFWLCKQCWIQQRPLKIPPTKRRYKIEVQIPQEYADAKVEDLPTTFTDSKGVYGHPDKRHECRTLAKKWPKTIPFMILAGCPGSGKTRMVWAYMRQAAAQGRTITHLHGKLAQSHWAGRPHQHERDAVEKTWREAPLLIIDNLNTCNASFAWRDVIHRIIDARKQEKIGEALPLLITTAMGPDSLTEVFGEEIHSRTKQFTWVYLPPKDHRGAKAEGPAEEAQI